MATTCSPTPPGVRPCGQGAGATSPAVLLCACQAGPAIQRDRAAETAGLLRDRGVAVLEVPDLCGAAARRDPAVAVWATRRPLVAIACRPRSVRALLRFAGLDDAAGAVEVHDLRASEPLAVVAAIEGRPGLPKAPSATVAPDEPSWVPWFPAIDRARCTRCGQCASFCLFGVYSRDARGDVTVTNPHGCKTGCPACARICPAAAIVFPKHDEPPFDGSEVADEEAVQARIRQYSQELLGQDPYATLQARRQQAELLRRRPAPEVRP